MRLDSFLLSRLKFSKSELTGDLEALHFGVDEIVEDVSEAEDINPFEKSCIKDFFKKIFIENTVSCQL